MLLPCRRALEVPFGGNSVSYVGPRHLINHVNTNLITDTNASIPRSNIIPHMKRITKHKKLSNNRTIQQKDKKNPKKKQPSKNNDSYDFITIERKSPRFDCLNFINKIQQTIIIYSIKQKLPVNHWFLFKIMSLLLNLINYSSSLQNQFRLTSPKQEDRPRSVYHEKVNDQNLQRNHMSSRSLSKLFPQKPEVNINPKTRILHRVTHLLSIKCKKHYYAFFVTLETIKKKNLYLTQDGQFDKIQNQKHEINLDLNANLHTKQNLQEITHLQLKVKDSCKQKCIFAMLLKIEQIQNLFLMKQFQKKEKSQFFKWLKFNYLYKDKFQKLTNSVESLKTNYKFRQFIIRLKKINQYVYKLQILSSILQSIDKRYHKHYNYELKTLKKQAMLKLAKFISKQPNFIDNLKVERQNHQIEQKSPQKILQTKKYCILYFTDVTNLNTNAIKMQQPLPSIQQRILNFQKKQFQGEYTTFLKTQNIKTEVDSLPMEIQKQIFCERNSMISKKLPKNYLSINFNDESFDLNQFLSDRSSLQRISINRNSKLKQSRVSLYDQIRPLRINPKMIGSEPSASEQRFQNLQISQISAISQLKSQKSTTTLLNESKMNVSCFGGQAVNFKNSLVQERESLKNSQKNFIKKPRKTQDLLHYPKELLRSSFDNERKLITYAAEKNHQNWVKVECANNVGKHKNLKSEDEYGNNTNNTEGRLLSRIPSIERQKMHQIHPFQIQSNLWHKINQGLLENQTVFPTRDNSSSYYTQRVEYKRQQKKTPTQNSNKIRGCIKLTFNGSNRK